MTSRSRSLIIAAIAVVVIAGVVAVRGYIMSDVNVDYYGDAVRSLSQARSVAVDVVVTTIAGQASVANVQGKLGVSGTPAAAAPVVVRGALNLTTDGSKPFEAVGSWTLSGVNADQVLATAETRIDKTGTSYLRLSGLPPPAASGADLNDKWLTLDRNALVSFVPWLAAGNAGPDAPFDIGPERKAVVEGPLFTVIDRIRDEQIDGTAVADYQLELSSSGAAAFLDAIGRTLAGRDLTTAETQAVQRFIQRRKFTVDAYVDKHTHRFHRIELLASPVSANDGIPPLGITLNFRALDPGVQVTAPKGALPLRDVVTKGLTPGTAAK